MDTLVAYFNGAWVATSELAIGVDDLGFLLGATVTERLRTFRGKVFRLDAHLRRMRRSLQIVGLNAEAIVAQVAAAVPELVERNHSRLDADDDWAISAFATPGRPGTQATRRGEPTVCVHCFPLPFGQWAKQYERGLPIVVSQVRQVPPNCWPPELKCRSRMHYYIADARASAERPGARALLLDQDGNIGEATSANVLIYREAEGLLSPPGEHILYGVSLGVVRELAGRLAMPFQERHLTVDELLAADEAMLTSTSVCLLPIVECNHRPIGGGTPGPMYRRLLATWSDLVGLDVAEQAQRFAVRG
jgi:branched-chain amino acid aminotransferase